jgi:2-keto-4-pentenoate hydratase
MNQAQIDKAAQILWNAWDNGETISELPKDCRPTDRQTAYKIQKEVGKLSRSSQIG